MTSVNALSKTLERKESQTVTTNCTNLTAGGNSNNNEHHNDIFYVVDGEVEVRSEMFKYTATKGSYVVADGENLLSFINNSNRKVSLLWLK